jgi:hypothetical protein
LKHILSQSTTLTIELTTEMVVGVVVDDQPT